MTTKINSLCWQSCVCLVFAGLFLSASAFAEPSADELKSFELAPTTSTTPIHETEIGLLHWVNHQLQSQLDDFPADSALHKKSAELEHAHLLAAESALQARTFTFSDYAVTLMLYLLWAVVLMILVYTARHYYFTFNRMFGKQRHPYIDIDTASWPSVTIFIAAHNEEAVIAHSLQALLEVDYPHDKIQIMPMNDRSKDRTKEIIDDFVARYPGRITPFHRTEGKPGKAAALKDATALVSSEILIIFDADYVPGRGLIKQLIAPFFDPENGAVMGRVVPLNTSSNLLTRLLDMERSGGYQVDQQARMNLHLVPQYGGTVGGVRRSALDAVGGWRDDALAEDTDLTYRLLLGGWKTIYQNRSECYEEVPEGWGVRVRQIMRWSKGHNQAAIHYSWKLFLSKKASIGEKIDGILLLGVYAMSPILLFGWILAITLFYFSNNNWLTGILALFALMSYSALGNFAAFFEIGAAVYLDGSRGRIKLMPLNYFGFLISLLAISRATFNQIVFDTILKRSLVWDKTVRYRQPVAGAPATTSATTATTITTTPSPSSIKNPNLVTT